MRMKLILASGNKHKMEEIAAMLPQHFELKSMKDLGILDEIPETGRTLQENAELKAHHVYGRLKARGIDAFVLADDSGLEVKALNGAPGVYSARYAGEPKSDVSNNSKLLHELKNNTKREARFVTVLSLIMNGETHAFEGELKGTISYEPRGSHGFGYDPVFIPRGYRSTLAELGEGVKNSISHRAEALKKLLVFFESNLH